MPLPAMPSRLTRRTVARAASAGAWCAFLLALCSPVDGLAADSSVAVRPFHVRFPDEALADLRRRIAATRWPDRETVAAVSLESLGGGRA